MKPTLTTLLVLLSFLCLSQPPTVLDPPAWAVDGINEIDDETVLLQLFAPNKDEVYVVGDFNGWTQDANSLMNVSTDGNLHWIILENLTPGEKYRFQYHIWPDNIRVADVHADEILDPWNDQWIPFDNYPGLTEFPGQYASDPVSVFQTAQTPYNWTDQGFARPPGHRLIIYELLVRDFVDEKYYDKVIEKLPYLESLGINAIEIMPFNEFEGNESWGYNPAFYFAPDKFYGPKNELKRLINECHQRGMSVVMDMTLNHSFGTNPQVRMYFDTNTNQPTPENPWFNQTATHDFSPGYDYNHSSPVTRDFCKRVLKYWLDEYHIDGFRMDLSKGFTQNVTVGNIGAWNAYDQSRIDILNDYANHCWWASPGSYFICEHFADNNEEQALAGSGMMIWGNMHENYKDSQLGYMSDLSWGSYQSRGYAFQNLVTYMESHDEERLMFESLQYGNSFNGYDVQDLSTALARMEQSFAFLLGIPGPKMMWQFGEMGYDESIELCGDGTFHSDCRVDNKPTHWEYLADPDRLRLYKVVRALNWLRRDHDVFATDNFGIDLWGHAKAIRLYHPDMNVVIIGNFDVATQSIIPGFPQTGTWYDYFSGTSFDEFDLGNAYSLEPGEYHVYTDVQLPVPDTDGNAPLYDVEVGCTDTDAVNYNPIAELDGNNCQYNITFTVDMSDEVVAPEGVHIVGGFQGWNPGGTPMTDNGDGTWSYTSAQLEGQLLTYRFINGDDWGEDETVFSSCGIPDGFGAYNRHWTVAANDNVPVVCYGSCVSCPAPQVQVTFRVNMIEESIAPQGVHLAGDFQGWTPGITPMTDMGAGVWAYTATFDVGQELNYKFVNGNQWGLDELVPPECAVDENRFHIVGNTSEDIPVVCFSACTDCTPQSNPGCIDPAACNYDPQATIDDGSCFYNCSGCTDPLACNYDPTAQIDDGSCSYDCAAGCTDEDAENYDPLAQIDDGTCLYAVTLLVDISEEIPDPAGVHVAGSFQGWDPSATQMTDLGAGLWQYQFTMPAGSNAEFKFVNGDAWGQDEGVPAECGVDNGFGGYNRFLNVGAGPLTYGVVCFAACDPCPGGVVSGCMDVLACNFDPLASVDDGSCVYDCLGCTDSGACNYDLDATMDDGSCNYDCLGCTDQAACNFDPTATIDDASCQYDCPGCTYTEATNYDPLAVIDDGSCMFGPNFCGPNTIWDPDLSLCVGTDSCPGDFNDDGMISTPDLLGFLAVFATTCP